MADEWQFIVVFGLCSINCLPQAVDCRSQFRELLFIHHGLALAGPTGDFFS
jgi:hypothetical protein